VVQRRPNEVESQINLGEAYRMLEQWPLAVAAYQAAISLKPDSADIFSNLGEAYSRMGQNDLAVDAYSRASELQPGDAELRLSLGLAYLRAGNRKGAETELSVLKTTSPEQAQKLQRAMRVPAK